MDGRNKDYRNFAENTPYEGKFDRLNGLTCFGIITGVNNANRTVTVRTMAPMGHQMADKLLKNVRTLQMMATSNGDEAWASPPLNSRCVVIVVESVPFVVGFYNPDQSGFNIEDANAEPLNNRQLLATGDIVFHNAFTSRFIIRNFGLIELQATENCKTYYDPEDDYITTICENHEMFVSGGSAEWLIDNESLDTLMTAIFYDQAEPTNIARIEIGQVAGDNIFAFKTGAPDDNLDVSATNTLLTIADDGRTTFTVSTTSSIDIDASGNITTRFDGNSTKTVTGTTTLTSTGDITSTTDGQIMMKAAKDVTAACVNFIAAATGSGNKLGAGAAEAMILGEQMFTFLMSFVQAFNSHTHQYVWIAGPSQTAPPTVPAPAPTPALKSTKWKVE